MTDYKVLKPLRHEGKKYEPGKIVPLSEDVNTDELIKLEVIECLSQNIKAKNPDNDDKTGGEGANPLNNGSKQEGSDDNTDISSVCGNPVTPDSSDKDGTNPPPIAPEAAGDLHPAPLEGVSNCIVPEGYKFLTAKEQIDFIITVEDKEFLEKLLECSKSAAKTAIKKRIAALKEQGEE